MASMNQVTEQVIEQVTAKSATATTNQLTSTEGIEPGYEPVSPRELNAWRRGFTPQAEIWNGRLAMIGLSVGLSVLVAARLLTDFTMP